MVQRLSFFVSMLAGMLWVVVFSLLCKLSGVPKPGRFQERPAALRRLSLNQYVCLFGGLGWGFAMFVSSVVDDYIRRSGESFDGLSLVFRLVGWLASGCVFGWLLWGGSRQDHSLP
jgi:hypothetical protein